MIDLFKVVTFNKSQIETVWNNPLLVYKSSIQYRRIDEIMEIEERAYKNITFKKHHNRLEIYGSIHYYWNNGLHNANDLSVTTCIKTFQELIEKFIINPVNFKLSGLEYGYNIQLDQDVNQVLKCLKFYHKKQINESMKIRNFYKAGTPYKSIKVYNKSQDCRGYSKVNIMRFEVKISESQFLNNGGLFNLSDLLLESNYITLAKSIKKEWDNVIIFDQTLKNLDEKHTTEYWLDSIHNKSRNTFRNRRNRYIEQLPKNSLFSNIKKLIIEKEKEIINYKLV